MKEHYYFDNASTSWPKPETVYQYMDQFNRQFGVNPGRAGHEMSLEAERMVTETRRLLANFFNFTGDKDRVVFTLNATDSLNTALFGILNSGDHVVSSRIEHNSVIRPMNYLERDHGIKVSRIDHDEQGYINPDEIKQAIRPGTKMIVINHGSNVLGSVQDIKIIGKISRDAGVIFVVDTCQTAGVIPIDMENMCIDILVFTGHKGLFGPMGTGGMLIREVIDIRPGRVGGTGINSNTPFQPEDYPHHLEAGTVALPGIAGLNAAQKWFANLGKELLGEKVDGADHRLLCRAALDHIDEKEKSHINQLVNAFRKIENVKVYGPNDGQDRIATLSINIGNLPANQTGDMLDADYSVCVRAGLHCAPLVHEDANTITHNGTVRFSPGYFTDEEDIKQAILGVKELAEM